jgi:hypothetical protein
MMEMSASEASALRELCATGTTAPGKCTALKARSSTIDGGGPDSGIACTETAELPSTEPASCDGGIRPGANRTATEPTSGDGGTTPRAHRTASAEATTTYCTAMKSASTSAVKPAAASVKAATTATMTATALGHRRGS